MERRIRLAASKWRIGWCKPAVNLIGTLANQASAEAQQQSQRAQAEYARQTAVVQAQYKAEIDKAQAEAAQAGPLAQAQAQMEVLAAQAEAFQLAILELLIDPGGVPKVAAQAISLLLATPINFIGNKLWSFRLD